MPTPQHADPHATLGYSLRSALHGALLDALAVVLPVQCAGCGTADRAVCAECRAEMLPSPHTQQLECDVLGGLTVTSALRYQGVVRSVVLALKEHGRTDTSAVFAPAMRHTLHAAVAIAAREHGRQVESRLEAVAVPSSPSALRRRGFDPVAVLCSRSGIRRARVLRHVRSSAVQKSLGRSERHSNRAFTLAARGRVDRGLRGRYFLIVDDIVTTGATLAEAARAITAAGGTVCGALTLAWTPLRTPKDGFVTFP